MKQDAQEIEIKFLHIDPQKIEAKLLQLGAKKISDTMLEEWIFRKTEWDSVRGRARVRVDGEITTVSYKETTKKTSEGNLEIEFVADNATQARNFIQKLGIPQIRHQQKRRIHFVLDDVSVDIDFWPLIPPFLEIEGKSLSSIKKVVKKLKFSMSDACELDALQVIKQIYKVDPMAEYIF